VEAPPGRGPTVAAGPTANVPSPPAPAEPPLAVGGTRGDGLETNPLQAKQQPPSPVIAREEQPAPAAIARVEQPRPAPAPATQRPRQQVAVENTWLARMRAELVVCGKPGLWRNDICREATRWKYCHPDRWRTVAECGVESFR
jgi:hypothetical protein